MNNNLTLRDIHLPDSVAWWPPAPGWWLLLLCIAMLVLAAIMVYRLRQRRQLHQAAQKELELIQHAFETHDDKHKALKDISIWLRRVCISFYPRMDVAGLTGDSWLAFLDQVFIDNNQPARFSADYANNLLATPYQKASTELNNVDTDTLFTLCQSWLSCIPKGGSQT